LMIFGLSKVYLLVRENRQVFERGSVKLR
jgi:hypothetical protein